MENPVLNHIIGRRSIRSYGNGQVTKEELNTVITAGLWAASANNMQSWLFTVIQDMDVRKMINRTIQEMFCTIPITPNTHPYYKQLILQAVEEGDREYLLGAPTLVIVSNLHDNENAAADSALAIGNMMIAAHSIGLGTCWLNLLVRMKEAPEIREMMNKLDIPKNHLIFGALALGYPGEQPSPPPRRDGTIQYFL